MKTNQLADLSSRIEQLIQDHIAACRATAQEALERAFAAASMASKPPPASATKAKAAAKHRARRRGREELQELSEKLYNAVCTQPGETMATLGATLGVAGQDLQRPMALLRGAERVRSVGNRHFTRYFPMAQSEAAAA